MSIKSVFAIPFAKQVRKRVYAWARNPHKTQEKVFKKLISKATNTAFGKDHDFKNIQNYEDFKKRVSVSDYEGLRPYIDRIVAGEKDVLWKGKPLYFAKTSGTTSGAKYIPITKDSMPTHITAARNALLFYIAETNDASFVNGKMIFLQGSPVLESEHGIKLGRLSGIVAHYVPQYLLKNRLPSWDTNCIEDWDTKVNAIVEEHAADTIVLARYMQIIPPELCVKYVGQVINIHHSFLPSFVGAKPYHQAAERGVKLIGATCHYVTQELDAGPIIDQDVIRISHNDTVEDMVRLGKDVEKSVLARGVRSHLEDRVLLHGNKTIVF